jgi:hypothetical protein
VPPPGLSHEGLLKPAANESPAVLIVMDTCEGELVPPEIPPARLMFHPVNTPAALVENRNDA